MEHYYNNIEGWFSFNGIYTRMINKNTDNSHFVEVGSWKGRSAVYMGVEILNSNKNIKFDCIDIWDLFGPTDYPDNDKAYQEFLKNIEPVKNIVNHYKMTSEDAANMYEDNSLDFVFIDANHTYDFVKNDLNYWYPKVKIGGAIGGHDYFDSQVKRAVNEFFINKQIETPDDSWLYFK